MFSSLSPIPFLKSDPAGLPGLSGEDPGFVILFSESPLPMWIFDFSSHRFLAVNQKAVARYGWSREEFLAMRAEEVRPAGDLEGFSARCRAMEASEESSVYSPLNWRHRTKSGEILAVHTVWQKILYQGHLAILVMVVDRSEQQRMEAENRELASVLNRASDAIIVCDLDRRVLFWNKGAEKIYTWKADEANGKNVCELLGIGEEGVMECMKGLIARGEWAGEAKHLKKCGAEAVVSSRWTLAEDEDGGESKTILIINSDVTETKKLEAQLLRAQRLEGIGTLASGIAHDLNNILSPILMATGILQTSEMSGDDAKMLEIIQSSAERGAWIVKQVLTFARGVQSERIPLQSRHLISDMVKVMQQTFPKNIDIRTQLPKELWLLVGDATQMHQVLLNLCVNARDAMGEKGGHLNIACENMSVDEHLARMNPGAKLGPHVCISVTDSGSGMSAETLEKIFEPFFTTKEQGKGTGLGLATVIGIVKGHGGFITIQSQVGEGTTFCVFIPADVEAQSAEPEQESEEDLRGAGQLILVVDDEAPVREAIVATLNANGYRCYTAEDGTDALALYFERREISVVITDIHMGMMDGITLARSLRKLNPDVKIIASSGHIQKETHGTLAELGIQVVLNKPYTSERLLRGIKEVLSDGNAR